MYILKAAVRQSRYLGEWGEGKDIPFLHYL